MTKGKSSYLSLEKPELIEFLFNDINSFTFRDQTEEEIKSEKIVSKKRKKKDTKSTRSQEIQKENESMKN
jgi:hypothetical protein